MASFEMVLYLAALVFVVVLLGVGLADWTGSADEHVRRLAWHALTYRENLAFPGEQLLRLSMDLATGSAGILLALGAALHAEPINLPFLEADRAVPGREGGDVELQEHFALEG